MQKSKSLADYATKRFRLAGKAYLDEHNPFFVPVDKARREAEARGARFVSFANYDYLGLANHPELKAAANEAVETIGIGALASRLVGGERSTHHILEEALAEFVGTEEVMTLVSGYLTNVTVISHIMASRDAIFLDELSHNSIVSGCKASPAEVIFFRHNDLDHLDELLAKRRAEFKNVLIVSESLFSMDGDTVDLPRLVALKKKHATWLLLDEAHSIGVLGANGRGLCEYSGVDPNDIDLIVGTLSKSFASCGGFVCAKSSIIQWMRHTLPGFVYSVGLSPVISASALQALRLCQSESWRIERLRRNSEFFVELAREAGLDTGPAIGRGVVPILFRDSLATLQASQHLLAHGFYVPPIIQVGVPKDQPRLRFFLSASHTEAEIRDVIAILATLQSADMVDASLAATTMAAPGLAESGLAESDLAESGLADPALLASVHEQMGAAS
ncbi:MAG: aminotransferase class I/II-fold pyridoxal phosphate-dependent enzyme [Beijerinckiaceae bacterium]|nr:aminotransferase class I/II-fold pyridoxal phosphate-dependent enzyme [Beijerinckiaceae bacterium]